MTLKTYLSWAHKNYQASWFAGYISWSIFKIKVSYVYSKAYLSWAYKNDRFYWFAGLHWLEYLGCWNHLRSCRRFPEVSFQKQSSKQGTLLGRYYLSLQLTFFLFAHLHCSCVGVLNWHLSVLKFGRIYFVDIEM